MTVSIALDEHAIRLPLASEKNYFSMHNVIPKTINCAATFYRGFPQNNTGRVAATVLSFSLLLAFNQQLFSPFNYLLSKQHKSKRKLFSSLI